MGWDAFAARNGRGLALNAGDTKLKTPSMRRAFEAAAQRVVRKAGTADGLLQVAGLDCTICGDYMSRSTGFSVYDEEGWDAAKVKQAAKAANWPDDPPDADLWAVLSARAFVETCAKHSLGIHFSW